MIPKLLLNGAITEEIDNWYDLSIISKDLRDILVERYPVSSAKGMVISVLITVGSVMVGLGSLLFIASHWSQISVYGKLSLILLSLVITNAAGWWLKFKTGSRPRLGEALFLLGAFFYGSGIWLVSQIFNISGDLPQGLLLWSIGTSAVALATGSAILGVMSTILISSWTMSMSTSLGAQGNYYSISGPVIVGFVCGTLASLALSYRLRSPWSLANTLLGASAWLLSHSPLSEFGFLVWGTILFNLYLLHCTKWPLMAPPYLYIGVIPVLGSLLTLTFDQNTTLELSVNASALMVALLTISWATSLAIYTTDQALKNDAIFTGVVSSSALILGNLSAGLMRIFLSNSLFLAVAIGLLYLAIKKLRNVWLVNTTMVFLAIYILCRYFDTFFSIMDRSFFFLLGGTLLMIVGAIAERKRRELLEGLRA